jgi:hypothetical protein
MLREDGNWAMQSNYIAVGWCASVLKKYQGSRIFCLIGERQLACGEDVPEASRTLNPITTFDITKNTKCRLQEALQSKQFS